MYWTGHTVTATEIGQVLEKATNLVNRRKSKKKNTISSIVHNVTITKKMWKVESFKTKTKCNVKRFELNNSSDEIMSFYNLVPIITSAILIRSFTNFRTFNYCFFFTTDRGKKITFYSGANTLFMFGLRNDSWTSSATRSFSLGPKCIKNNRSPLYRRLIKTHSRHAETHIKTCLWLILGSWPIILKTLEVCFHQHDNKSTACCAGESKTTLQGNSKLGIKPTLLIIQYILISITPY